MQRCGDRSDLWPLYGLPTVAGTSGRRASSRGRCTVHHALLTIERSLISRTGARRSPEGCSPIEIGGPKHELKRITYFDLLESFTFPFGAQGGRPRRHRCPTRHNHDLPKPIRRRRPPFLLQVDARASAVRSNAFAGRERAPMTQATSSSPSRLQSWQHEAEMVHGRQGKYIIRRHYGAVWSVK